VTRQNISIAVLCWELYVFVADSLAARNPVRLSNLNESGPSYKTGIDEQIDANIPRITSSQTVSANAAV